MRVLAPPRFTPRSSAHAAGPPSRLRANRGKVVSRTGADGTTDAIAAASGCAPPFALRSLGLRCNGDGCSAFVTVAVRASRLRCNGDCCSAFFTVAVQHQQLRCNHVGCSLLHMNTPQRERLQCVRKSCRVVNTFVQRMASLVEQRGALLCNDGVCTRRYPVAIPIFQIDYGWNLQESPAKTSR